MLFLDEGQSLNQRMAAAPADRADMSSLLEEARLGAAYEGLMMMQWRNIGLRGRPQLLRLVGGWKINDVIKDVISCFFFLKKKS